MVSINTKNHELLDPTFQIGIVLGRLKLDVKKLKIPQLNDLTGESER